jgi:hypothetical protein
MYHTGCVDVNMHGVMQHRCVLYQSAVAGSVRAGLPGFDSRKRQWDFSRSWSALAHIPRTYLPRSDVGRLYFSDRYNLSVFIEARYVLLIYRVSGRVLGCVMASVLSIAPKTRGFEPGRVRWIFKGDKNPQHAFFRRGSKAGCPVS